MRNKKEVLKELEALHEIQRKKLNKKAQKKRPISPNPFPGMITTPTPWMG